MKINFLGTPPFVQPIREVLSKHFTLIDSLDQADLGVVAAYGRILKKEELNTPKYGLINVHPSLLPKYRGPSPIQSAILQGDKTTGISVIKMDEKMDHGPIIYQEGLELSDYDNFDTLSKKMFLRASEILPKIIEGFISGKIKAFKQDHEKATYCKTLKKEDGYFDITPPADEPTIDPEKLNRIIRAYYPWPSAWTRWKGKIVKFLPGNMMQMEGKKAISKQDFFNGYPDFPSF